MIKSVCIVRLSALGDVLMLVPLIRTLQDNLPGVEITWIISRPAYYLVEGMTGIEFIVIDKPEGFGDYWRFRQAMKQRQFDVLLAVQASFRANLLYPFIKAHRKIGYDALRAKDGHGWFVHERIMPGQDHTLDGFLKFADALGIIQRSLRWDMPITHADYAWAEHYTNTPDNRPILLVNPAASKPERSWLIKRYIEVIAYAQEKLGMTVILIGGPGHHDRELADAILSHIACLDLVGQTKPKQLLALISQASLVLCPDTGPSHMAVAVGTPVVALHAVTSSAVSGPYLYRHFAVDCYPEAVKEVLHKTHTSNRWGTHAHGDKTMQLVSVKAVLAKLHLAFESIKPDCQMSESKVFN